MSTKKIQQSERRSADISRRLRGARVLYFCDEPFNGTPKEDWERVAFQFSEGGVEFKNVEVTTKPPFRQQKNYDVMVFDWGGMSIGNSLLEHFCRYLLEEAEERPSKDFVMASSFTTEAMKDAVSELGKVPPNVFLTIDDYCKVRGRNGV